MKLHCEQLESRDCPSFWPIAYGRPVKPAQPGLGAVVDTGVDMRHPEITKHLWTNWGETINGLDDDRNGYVDDYRGWDFAAAKDIFAAGSRYGDNLPFDEHGHGTHVAGIFLNTGLSFNQYLYVMPVRVLDRFGSGTGLDVAKGIVYAVANGASVINLSLGSYQFDWDVYLAISYANAYGRIVVGAAGNASLDIRYTPSYPASIWGVVSVSALNEAQTGLAKFSNYGASIAAPGEKIDSTLPGNRHGKLSGTSMAAPHVAAVMAMVWSKRTGWNAAMVKARVLNAGDAFDESIRYGKLDPAGVLQGL